jgi:calcineurin-like phosphoesterase family protein
MKVRYFFTADEHYGHSNIIRYCNRPFEDVFEMNCELIKRHNEIISKDCIVIHAGDFSLLRKRNDVMEYVEQLNGYHVFLKGSHDTWITSPFLWEKTIEGMYIVVCHYAMLTWPRSHYGSRQLFGHSHGKLEHFNRRKQYDIGVDNNNFYPVPFEEIRKKLA